MSNLLKKIVVVGIASLIIGIMVGPGIANAQTTAADLEARIAALMKELDSLKAQLAELRGGTPPAPGVEGCTITSFDRNLKQGMSGDDVNCLQIVLNSDAETQLATEGVGSPGKETSYFGPLTKGAVIKFQEKYASDVLAPWGLTEGTGFVGSTTRAKLNDLLTGVTPPPTTCQADADCDLGYKCADGSCVLKSADEITTEDECTAAGYFWYDEACNRTEKPAIPAGLTVELAADTPAAGTLVSGTSTAQGVAPLAKFTFTNGDSEEVKVTQLKLKRLGVSADATLSNVYLFEGANRLTDAASVSSGVITFSDTAGIFKIAAGASKTITVKSDLATSHSGETVGVGINEATDITTDASSVNGTFPMNGNLHSLASGTLAGVAVSNTTPTGGTIDPQNDYNVWQSTFTVTTRAVNFTRFSLREIGTVDYSALENFRLYVDGTQVGSAVANLDDDGYVTFDLSASPKRLETGARIIKVVADIISGSNRTFSFSLRKSADANFTDTQYDVGVTPSGTFPASSCSNTCTISPGKITITKMSDSPAGNVVNGAPAVTLAKYEVKAAGEKVKIESLKVYVIFTNNDSTGDDTASSTSFTLRNGMLLANGVQVGSTTAITNQSTGTQFNLGSSLIVEPGSPVTLEVVADIYDNAGSANDIDATDTLQVRLIGNDSLNNAQGMVSLTTIDVPSNNKDGNQLTVAEGDLTLSKYTAYTDQSMVPPLTAAKLAHFTLTAGTTEDVNLNTITVDFDNSNNTGAFDASDDLSNLYVTYGGNTTTAKATVADSANSWSINYTLTKGTTIDLIVYADVDSDATDGGTDDTCQADMTVSGTTAESATTATGSETSGQTITFRGATFATAVGDNTPLAQIVAGGQTITAATFKFTSLYDTSTIKEVKVKLNNANAATISRAINNVILKDGDTVLGTKPLNETSQVDDTGSSISNSATTFTGLSVSVPANTSKTLTVDLDLAIPSSSVSSSQVNVAMTLDSVKYASSQGTENTSTADKSGNALYVYKSIPTFTYSALSGSTFINGSQTDIYEFKVAADSKGAIGLKQIKLSVTWDDAGDGDSDTLLLGSFKFFRNGTDISGTPVTIQNSSGTSVESGGSNLTESDSVVVITFATEEVISAGDENTYKIAATPSGFGKTSTGGDGFSIKLAGDSASTGIGSYVYLRDSDSDGVYGLATSNSASENAKNIIWSDRSSLSHSYTNDSASNDWAFSYLVNNLDLPSKGWTR